MAMMRSFSHARSSQPPRAAYKPPRPSRFAMALNFQANSRKLNGHATSRIPQEKWEVFKSSELMSWGEENFVTMLKPVEKSWQPQDLLPDPASDGFFDEISRLRDGAAGIPDDYLVCLIGNMITEEALPTYQTMLNTMDGFRDMTGADQTPWGTWIRMWTAEENRHGDLLNRYLYLTGRCDMRQVEKTIQYLIGAGMVINHQTKLPKLASLVFLAYIYFYFVEKSIKADNNPYNGFIYTSFQERATFVSHCNTAKLAKHHGDATLAKICGLIAGDEKRHEMAYAKMAEKLFELDPDGMMQAFATMMRKRITMPAQFMFDGQDHVLFDHFGAVSQRLGVYTAQDYVGMVEFFVKRWKVEEITDLSSEGRKAQDYVCGLAERFKKLEEKALDKNYLAKNSPDVVQFSWIFNKSVTI